MRFSWIQGVCIINFHGPDANACAVVSVSSRSHWNDFTGNPSKPDEATRKLFATTYAQPGGMRAGFAQFTAFSQDARTTESSGK